MERVRSAIKTKKSKIKKKKMEKQKTT